MPKSPFRIIAFRCLRPEHPIGGELHYVNRMQRSLSAANRWFKFYQNANVSDDGRMGTLPNDFYNDGMVYRHNG